MHPEVSVILPAYNEANVIENTLKEVRDALLELDRPFEIIIAENGSTDGTDVISKRLSEEYEEVEYLHTEKGRGNALRAAFSSSRGGIVVYMDVDLATDLRHLGEIIEAIEGGHDFATGSRLLPQSIVEGRLTRREIASRGYNFLVRTLLKSEIRDHQCGFKAFKRDSLLDLIGEVKDNHWFLDTEVLVKAQKKGYKVAEIPIVWRDSKESKVDIVQDLLGMGSNVFGLWWDLTGRHFMDTRGKSIIGIGIGLAVLLLMANLVGYERVVNALSTTSLPLLLFAGIFFSSSYIIRGLRYRYILKSIGTNESLKFLIGAVLLSQLANLIMPSRLGDVVRAGVLKERRGIDLNVGFASLIIERIYDIIAISSLGAFAFLIALGYYQLPSWLNYIAISFVAIIAIALSLLLLVSKEVEWLKRFFKEVLYKISSPGEYTDEVLDTLRKFVSNIYKSVTDLSLTAISFSSSYLVWIFETLTCFIVFKAFGMFIPILLIFIAISFGNLIKMIPTTPNSIGIYEVALTSVFTIAGVPIGYAFSIALLDHLVKNLTTLILGSAVMFRLKLEFKDVEYKFNRELLKK